MAYTLNPFTGKLDANGLTKSYLDTIYLLLDGGNNLTGSSSWLTQSAGDARYLLSSQGTVYDVSSTISVDATGLDITDFDSYTIVKVKGDGSAITVTETPNIARASYDGYLLILMGMDDTNTVTFQDGGTLAKSGLSLSDGQNMTLGKGDTLHLIYEAELDNWIEISRSNNTYVQPITAYVLLEDSDNLLFEDGTYMEEE